MKKVINMWRMTKHLDKGTLNYHKSLKPGDNPKGHVYKWRQKGFITSFAASKHMTEYQAYGILEDCIAGKYIAALGKSDENKESEDDEEKLLRVRSGKGTDLIDTLLGFPVGLVEAIWKKHGRFVLGALAGAVGTILIGVGKWVYHRYIAHTS